MATTSKTKFKGITTSKSKATKVTSYGTVSSLSIKYDSTTREAYGVWKWQKSHTDYYTVRWDYMNLNGTWVTGSPSNTSVGGKVTTSKTLTTYTVPDNAVQVRLYVLPVSTSHTVYWQTYSKSTKKWTKNSTTVKYWKATSKTTSGKSVDTELGDCSVSAEYQTAYDRAELTFGETDYSKRLYRYSNGSWTDASSSTGRATVADYDSSTAAAYDTGLIAGYSYKYATRTWTTYSSSTLWGDYSDFSEQVDAPPAAPTDFEVKGIESSSGLAFSASWTRGSAYTDNGETYVLRWYTAKSDLALDDGEYESATVDSGATSYSSEVDAAGTWYFAAYATNDSGDSSLVYSDAVVIGSTPAAPTMGSLATYVESGKTLGISWTFNSTDGSTQTAWKLEKSTDSGSTWSSVASGSDTDTSYNYEVEEDGGSTLMFRCATAGATGTYSEYGYTADVEVIDPLVVAIECAAEVTALPIELNFTSNIDVRQWVVTITIAEAVETTDLNGDEKLVAAGALVFEAALEPDSEDFDYTAVSTTLDPDDANIIDGASYNVVLEAVSTYGTTASSTNEFTTNYSGEAPEPDLTITPVDDSLEAHLFPVCYSSTDVDEEDPDAEEELTLRDDIKELKVWRTDPNGDRLLIAEGIENTGTVELVDPYPNFGTASYRIAAVATDGSIGFMDQSVDVDCNEVVIQFADGFKTYSDDSDEDTTQGEIRLPYNLEISETYDPDVSLVEYIGNSEPTLYTGTQRGATVKTSSVVLRVDDSDMVAMLRRYAGDITKAYYRDPTGLGFWAYIKVGLSTAYDSAAVSVDLDITRITGDYAATIQTVLDEV